MFIFKLGWFWMVEMCLELLGVGRCERVKLWMGNGDGMYIDDFGHNLADNHRALRVGPAASP